MASDSKTTPNEIIRGAILSVCSDGNSDANRVTLDVIHALEQAGWEFRHKGGQANSRGVVTHAY